MESFNFTIKNYRCFEDTNPLRFQLKDGFISFIGPNNSGKSAFLKFFREFRNIWASLTTAGSISNLSETKPLGVHYLDVYDDSEIFSDKNERLLSIEIDFILENCDIEESNTEYLSSIKIFSEKMAPTNWRGGCYYGIEKTRVTEKSKTQNNNIITDEKNSVNITCEHFCELFRNLHSCLYIGPFRNAINEGSGSDFDLAIGASFISTWHNWKTGASKTQNQAITNITHDIRNIFEFDYLEINASEELKTLTVTIDNKPYKLRELGAGLSQFIIVLGNVAIRKPSYILIDEPELHLHPTLQIDFLTALASYASKGVIFATHSMGLARSVSDHIYSFQRINNSSIVKMFEQTSNYIEFVGELSYSSYKELGFDKLLLVEGVKDVRTVQQFLRKLNKDHKVLILPLGGDQLASGGVEFELNEFKRITDKIYVLVDSERKKEGGDSTPNRQQFEKLCKRLGFSVLLTKYRAIENYLTDGAVKNTFSTKYRALQPYEKLEEYELCWGKSENWRIARNMDLDDFIDSDIGKYLSSI